MNIHVCVLFTVSNVTIKGLCLRTKSTKPTLIFLRIYHVLFKWSWVP